MKGFIVKTYPTLKKAAVAVGVNTLIISQCCRGLIDNVGGFKWAYVEKVFFSIHILLPTDSYPPTQPPTIVLYPTHVSCPYPYPLSL
jgi:hypothetical protein